MTREIAPSTDTAAAPTAAIAPLTMPDREVRAGRWATIGAVAGFLVVTGVVTVAGCITGLDLLGALGLGAFVAFWGGAGFGFMMGGCLAIALRSGDLAAATVFQPESANPYGLAIAEAAVAGAAR